MKKIFYMMASLMVILFASCEDRYAEMSEMIGNEELPTIVKHDTIYEYVEEVIVKDSLIYVFIHDTLIVENTTTDTIVVEKHDTTYIKGDTIINTVYDTVFVTRELKFGCYTFDQEGRIVATSTEGKPYVISYNLMIETSGDVYFTQECKEGFSLRNTTAKFINSNSAHFTVSKGSKEVTLEVLVRGAKSVIINNNEVFPCDNFEVEAEITNLNDRKINDRIYEVALVNYYFRNAEGNIVRRGNQYVFAPKAVTKPVNERNVNFNKYVDGDNLIITGTIDNSLLEDTTVQVRIPLTLSLVCGEPQVIAGADFKFTPGKTVSVVSSATVQNKRQENNSLVVSFEEVETVFKHSSTASGTTVIVNPTVRHYDNFVATFGGKTEEIDLGDLLVTYIDVTEGEASPTSKKLTLTYKASFAGITSTATQDVTINVNGTSFPGENILFGNKAVSFNRALGQGVMFTCLVTESTTDGKYYYRYRQDGISNWTIKEIDPAEKTFLENKIKGQDPLKHGLANYWDGKTWIPGTIRCEDFKKEAGYYSFQNGSFGIGQVALETMVNQGYSSAIKPMIHVSGSLYEIDGELYIVK